VSEDLPCIPHCRKSVFGVFIGMHENGGAGAVLGRCVDVRKGSIAGLERVVCEIKSSMNFGI
jgi:hypothetical protein